MALVDVDTAAMYLGVQVGDHSLDNLISLYVNIVSKLIEEDTGRRFNIQNYTEFYSGTNTDELCTRQRPVVCYLLQGSTTNGSAVVAGLSSNANLILGMPVNGPGIPAGATVITIDSGGTQVTLSANATVTSSSPVNLFFGLSVWEVQQGGVGGYYGDPTGSFDSTMLLAEGTDYVLARDTDNGNQSRSGRLIRLNDVWERPIQRTAGLLTPYIGYDRGSIKIMYTAGFKTIPDDLQGACLHVVAKLSHISPYGRDISSESYEERNIGYAVLRDKRGLLSEVAPILAAYKNLHWGG